MFRVENNVPDIYVNESRDFQLIARLYDLAIQSSRFSIDSLVYASDTMKCNEQLLPLLATKLGIFDNLKLTDLQYRQILSAFPYIIRYKGSPTAIQLVLRLFGRMYNTKLELETTDNIVDSESGTITLLLNDALPNMRLLYTLLDYVRPTGILIDYAVRIRTSVESAPYKFIGTGDAKHVTTSSKDDVSVVMNSIYKEVDDVVIKDSYTNTVGFTLIDNGKVIEEENS